MNHEPQLPAAPAALAPAMRRAIELARRGPRDDINPRVGCVILSPDGRIVAEGWHRGAGTPHAETDALAHLSSEWRGRMAELTAVVTLEPCNHTGRTGPCAEALIAAGLGGVAFAAEDTGEISSGGADRLRESGIPVRGNVLGDEGRALMREWEDHRRAARAMGDGPARNRPGEPHLRVIAKWAQTLDGRAAAADGSSRWITGPEARADVHRARAAADAILVGTGTLYDDDPTLTARNGNGELLVPPEQQPIPVVLGRREIPDRAKVLEHPALGAHGLPAPIRLTGENLAADLAELADRLERLHVGSPSPMTVFVEGGPTVISALLRAGLVDQVRVYIAPVLLGGARLALRDLGISNIGEMLSLTDTTVTRVGADLLITGTPRTPQEDSCLPAS